MGISVLFNDGWEFTRQELGTKAEDIIHRDDIWQKVDIPHD